MNRWSNTNDSDKIIAYNQISDSTNLPAYAIEKDWWVVQTLAILYELEIGPHLVFKGGTSLSKAWDVIERFSEDIDLAVDRKFLGFEGELGSSKREKLRKKSKIYITDTLYPALQKAMKSKGLENVKFKLEETTSSVEDPVIIYLYYPNVIESPGYIPPRVKIEIGCRSLREPFEARPIISLVDMHFPESDFSQSSVDIPTVLPQRTFLEKIFLLHEEFQRPGGGEKVERLSRHLYDVYQLARSEFASSVFDDKDLYKTIVEHRYCFTKWSGVDYNLHQPQTINIIPPAKFKQGWKDDYVTMQEQMIHGDSPEFDELLTKLTQLNDKINSIAWKMNVKFQ